jgi:hypothetical protein
MFLSIWNVSASVTVYTCHGGIFDLNAKEEVVASIPISIPNRNMTFEMIRQDTTLKSVITNRFTNAAISGFVFSNYSSDSRPYVESFAYGNGIFVFLGNSATLHSLKRNTH